MKPKIGQFVYFESKHENYWFIGEIIKFHTPNIIGCNLIQSSSKYDLILSNEFSFSVEFCTITDTLQEINKIRTFK